MSEQDRHQRIERQVAELDAWLAAEMERLRRSLGQRFRWLRVELNLPAPR